MSTASVSEQNTIDPSEKGNVPFENFGDEFSQMLQEAFSGESSYPSSVIQSSDAVSKVPQKNTQPVEQIKNSQLPTPTDTEEVSTPGQIDSVSRPIIYQANADAIKTSQNAQPPAAQADADPTQKSVADTKDLAASLILEKLQPPSKSDKSQAELRRHSSKDEQVQSAAYSTTISVPATALTSQQVAAPENAVRNSPTSVVSSSSNIPLGNIGRSNDAVITNMDSTNTDSKQQISLGLEDTLDKNAFSLSIRPFNSPNSLAAPADAIPGEASNTQLSTQYKAIKDTSVVGSENLADSAMIAKSADSGRTLDPGAATGGNSGSGDDSERAPSNGTLLLDKDRSSTNGAKNIGQTEAPFGGSLIAGNSTLTGVSTNPVSGKETVSSVQSSNATQPTDPQQAASGTLTKDVTVRLQGHSGETISIRLTDQGGQVQVAVRSSDASSASSLRQDLSSLTSNLDRIGWRTEVSNNASGSSNISTQNSSASGNNSRDDSKSASPDWEKESRRQKNNAPEIWEDLLYRHSN